MPLNGQLKILGCMVQIPSYHELKVPILKKDVAYTNELLSDHKESLEEIWLFYYVRWVGK